jgi:hypothetical protein
MIAEREVPHREYSPGEREVRVQLGGTRVERNRRAIAERSAPFGIAQVESLKSLQGCRGHAMSVRPVVWLNGGQRLAKFSTHGSHRPRECFYNAFFGGGLPLLSRDGHASSTVDRLKRQQVGRANASNRAFERGFYSLADADVACDLAGDTRIRHPARQPKRLADMGVVHRLEERRLTELKNQGLSQGHVEHTITGGVLEVGDYQHVLIR